MNSAPTTYAIRVEGHLDDHWSAWLGELDMTRNEDSSTTLTVSVADQAQLHGVLAGLRDIGAVLIELRATDAQAPIRRAVLERLTLRPAAADNADCGFGSGVSGDVIAAKGPDQRGAHRQADQRAAHAGRPRSRGSQRIASTHGATG
jgi:hypothetical protein